VYNPRQLEKKWQGKWEEAKIFEANPDPDKKKIFITSPYPYASGTMHIGNGRSFVNGDIFAMNPNGTLKWRFKTGNHIKAPSSIADDGTIYAPSYDGYLYAIYSNGTMKWKCPSVGAATNPAIGKDGTIYLSNYDKFHAIYPNGSKKWTFELDGSRHIDASDCAISSEGTIYVGANIGNGNGGEILALNSDGTERWRKKISDEECESSVCIGEDGTVYIGSQGLSGGYLHAFGPIDTNSPPETPTIKGETEGKRGEIYQYLFRVIDPDNNPVELFIDWGDGNEGWTPERASGENCAYRHEWNKKGNYTIESVTGELLFILKLLLT